jgi:hypothetical protein
MIPEIWMFNGMKLSVKREKGFAISKKGVRGVSEHMKITPKHFNIHDSPKIHDHSLKSGHS